MQAFALLNPTMQDCTHRPLSSSFLGLPYRVLNINHKKELLRGLWVGQQYPCLPSGSVLIYACLEAACDPMASIRQKQYFASTCAQDVGGKDMIILWHSSKSDSNDERPYDSVYRCLVFVGSSV